jgi:enoyl-CoA hydratase/carnithine racemase
MKRDRGYLCMNGKSISKLNNVEVELPSSLSETMASIIRVKLPINEWRNCALMAKRYSADEGIKLGIVDGSGSTRDELLDSAKTFSDSKLSSLSDKAGFLFSSLKASMYSEVSIAVEKERKEKIDMKAIMKKGRL